VTVYLVNVYLIDPNPDQQLPVFFFDTRAQAVERAPRFARMRDVTNADVIAPGGRTVASYTVSGFELVNLKED
jgi:hypothetical protein